MPTGRQDREDPGPSVKDDELYEKLRDEGNSEEKSARIANAAANQGRSTVGRRGGKSPSYEDWTVEDLHERATELDIDGRSSDEQGRPHRRPAQPLAGGSLPKEGT